jgi:hypothetical protein
MAPTFLDLPLEIRVNIYGFVFGRSKTIIEAKFGDDNLSILPRQAGYQSFCPRSSQLLRANKTILYEARPILYDNTVFHIVSQSFAGRLPTHITNGHPCAPHIRHVIWQLDCDMLKHVYVEELQIDWAEVAWWSSFEIRCRVDAWRDSFMGEWCDREAFLNGRTQCVDYVRLFHAAMTHGSGRSYSLVEDRSQLARGRIIFRVEGERSRLKQPQRRIEETLLLTTS